MEDESAGMEERRNKKSRGEREKRKMRGVQCEMENSILGWTGDEENEGRRWIVLPCYCEFVTELFFPSSLPADLSYFLVGRPLQNNIDGYWKKQTTHRQIGLNTFTHFKVILVREDPIEKTRMKRNFSRLTLRTSGFSRQSNLGIR